MSDNPTRRNHYIPQFYLNSFLKDTKFWVYYKDSQSYIEQTPINTCVEKDIYTFKNADGTMNDSIEKELGKTENIVKDILKRLREPKEKLENDDIPNLAVFVSFLTSRVPSTLKFAKDLGEELAKSILRKVSKNPKEINSLLSKVTLDEEFKKSLTVSEIQKVFANPDKYFEMSLNEKYVLSTSLVLAKDIYYELMEMNWSLCTAPDGHFYVTSDSPCVPFMLLPDGKALIGAGYGLDNIEVTFPISTHKCLFIRRKQSQRNIASSKKFVNQVNRRTAWNAERIVVSCFKTRKFIQLTEWSSQSLEIDKLDRDYIRQMSF